MALGLSSTEMISLVPEAEGWHGGVYGWITSMGSFSALIGYAELLWMDFALIDDCVVWASYDEERIRTWMEHLGGDRTAVERVCNHIDLIYLLSYQAEATDAQLMYLGRLFQDLWRAKLAREFPDRQFAVEFHFDPGNRDDEALVTFSQIRTA